MSFRAPPVRTPVINQVVMDSLCGLTAVDERRLLSGSDTDACVESVPKRHNRTSSAMTFNTVRYMLPFAI